MSEQLYEVLAGRLRDAHRRVSDLDLDQDEKARIAKRLIALTDASKRDVVRASARLDLLLADLDARRIPMAGQPDDAF